MKSGKLIIQYANEMKRRRYSESTQGIYNCYFSRFLEYFKGEDIRRVSDEKIKSYLLHLRENRNASWSQINQHINAIKFYYEKILHYKRKTYYIDRPKKEQRLPEVLSIEEVQRIISGIENLKHKAIIFTIYATGIRISECINLTLQDIKSDRKLIFVRGGKGSKDRYVQLPDNLLLLLRRYYSRYKPKGFLFEGQTGGKYSATSIRNILKKAMQEAGVNNPGIHVHNLRHSYATHMLESGVDITYIQNLLGHNSPKTTHVYTKISNTHIAGLNNPSNQISI